MRVLSNALRSPVVLSFGLAAIVVAGGCSSEPAPPPAPAAPAVKTAQERVQFYEACWDQFNNKDWDKFQNCYDPNAVSEAVDSNPPSITGRTAIIDHAKQELSAAPDRKGELRLILQNGDHTVSIAQYGGTNTGAMPPGPDGKPVPATNKPFGFLMAHTVDWDPTGSFAVRDAGYVEEGTFAGQLGLSPVPVRPVEKATGAPPTVVIAKNDATEQANLAAMQANLDAFNKHDLKAMEALLADNYRGIEIAHPADVGKKEAVASTKEMFGAFPDVKLTLSSSWAAGDYVVAFGVFEGTNKGDMPSAKMKATGKKVSARFCEIVKFENGKAVDDYLFYNNAAFMAQLMGK